MGEGKLIAILDTGAEISLMPEGNFPIYTKLIIWQEKKFNFKF
jgi:hypothetical protein